jgi:hypothetical protein
VSRVRLIAIAALALIAVGAFYAWRHFPRDDSNRTSVHEALHAFRQRLGRATVNSKRISGFPRPGVYRYTTHGREALDTAILSAEHAYHGVSTITIQPLLCGIDERWQVLTARWSEGILCRAERGFRLRVLSEYHEFFGTKNAVSDKCKGTMAPAFADLRVGMHWTADCTSGDSAVLNTSRVVAVGIIKIAGHVQKAVHIRSVAVFEGEDSGRTEQNDWRRKSDGLVLRRTVATRAHFDFVGGGSYSEDYSLMLVSPRPTT